MKSWDDCHLLNCSSSFFLKKSPTIEKNVALLGADKKAASSLLAWDGRSAGSRATCGNKAGLGRGRSLNPPLISSRRWRVLRELHEKTFLLQRFRRKKTYHQFHIDSNQANCLWDISIPDTTKGLSRFTPLCDRPIRVLSFTLL